MEVFVEEATFEQSRGGSFLAVCERIQQGRWLRGALCTGGPSGKSFCESLVLKRLKLQANLKRKQEQL